MAKKIDEIAEDVIDPNSWTTKELVKHLYRELKEVHSKQEKHLSEYIEIKGKLEEISTEVNRQATIYEERERQREEEIEKQKMRMKAYVAAASIVGGILTTVISFLLGI